MELRKEHEKHRELWDRRTSARSKALPQFRFQTDFYQRYHELIREPIIDVGCGDGEMLELMIKDGREDVYGIDISDVAVEMARTRLRPCLGDETDSRIMAGDMANLSHYYEAGFFNTIVCEGTFHQTTYEGARLTAVEMARITSNGALVYVSVRSCSTPPENAEELEEMGTYRLRDEGGVVRCYFSKEGLTSLFREWFDVLELDEKELIMRIGQQHYKMWTLIMRRR